MSRDSPSSARKSNSDGTAPFQVMLDQLLGHEQPAGTARFPPPSTPAFDPTYAAPPAAPGSFGGAAAELYADAETESDSPIEDLAVLLVELPTSVEEAVAQELRLSDVLQPAELERVRRRFAYRNHPDRVAPALKSQALERMTIANVLIDQALKVARTRVR